MMAPTQTPKGVPVGANSSNAGFDRCGVNAGDVEPAGSAGGGNCRDTRTGGRREDANRALDDGVNATCQRDQAGQQTIDGASDSGKKRNPCRNEGESDAITSTESRDQELSEIDKYSDEELR